MRLIDPVVPRHVVPPAPGMQNVPAVPDSATISAPSGPHAKPRGLLRPCAITVVVGDFAALTPTAPVMDDAATISPKTAVTTPLRLVMPCPPVGNWEPTPQAPSPCPQQQLRRRTGPADRRTRGDTLLR